MGIKYFWKYLTTLNVVKEKLESVDSKLLFGVTGNAAPKDLDIVVSGDSDVFCYKNVKTMVRPTCHRGQYVFDVLDKSLALWKMKLSADDLVVLAVVSGNDYESNIPGKAIMTNVKIFQKIKEKEDFSKEGWVTLVRPSHATLCLPEHDERPTYLKPPSRDKNTPMKRKADEGGTNIPGWPEQESKDSLGGLKIREKLAYISYASSLGLYQPTNSCLKRPAVSLVTNVNEESDNSPPKADFASTVQYPIPAPSRSPSELLQLIKSSSLHTLPPSQIYSTIRPLLISNPHILASRELVSVMQAMTSHLHPYHNPSNPTISNQLMTLFRMIKKNGFNPPSDAYTALVTGLSHSPHQVLKVLVHVSRNRELCSEPFYKAVLQAVVDNRIKASIPLLSNVAKSVWQAMKDYNIHPSFDTCILSLKAFGRIEDSDCVNSAYFYIMSRAIVDSGVWNALVEAFARVGLASRARTTMEYMEQKLNVEVQRSAWQALIEAHSRSGDVEAIIHLHSHFPPESYNKTIVKCLVNAYAQLGKESEVSKIYDQVHTILSSNNTKQLNHRIHECFVSAYSDLGNLNQAMKAFNTYINPHNDLVGPGVEYAIIPDRWLLAKLCFALGKSHATELIQDIFSKYITTRDNIKSYIRSGHSHDDAFGACISQVRRGWMMVVPSNDMGEGANKVMELEELIQNVSRKDVWDEIYTELYPIKPQTSSATTDKKPKYVHAVIKETDVREVDVARDLDSHGRLKGEKNGGDSKRKSGRNINV
ncbi:hypothetical protein SeLEV6574_g03612 [Synchytrium endobioticum]|uniref:Pentacotripeptide-repeat region of PRORP domain-containing protein n=1 Tax=Synchytrium endobioticum TaxID=286115 RepID=A0A507D3E4_9FUNG|nr:hypothetical protein SeLEV6574_g03612 [Synchytrium endobioticum]